jgi:hypothetical protein
MAAAYYRKKPIEIQAIQWTGDNLLEVAGFLGSDFAGVEHGDDGIHGGLYVHTLEGTMRAHIGDYILRGIYEEHYVCRQDIFEETYDPCGRAGEIIHPEAS